MEIKINLIPPERKKELAESNRLKTAIRIEIILTLILAAFFVMLLSFRYILDINLSNLEKSPKSEESEQYERIKNYDNQFGETNSQMAKIIAIKRDHLYWSTLFLKLDSLVFSGIDISNVSSLDYSVAVSGTAATREDLILFKEKIENESCFSNISLPLSNLVDKNNVEFRIDFEVKKDCLKKNDEKTPA